MAADGIGAGSRARRWTDGGGAGATTVIHVVPRWAGENVESPECGEWIKDDGVLVRSRWRAQIAEWPRPRATDSLISNGRKPILGRGIAWLTTIATARTYAHTCA